MPCKFCLVQLLLAAFVVSASWASPSAPAAPQNLRFAANSGNRAPSAVDDAYRAFQTTPLSVPAPGVLSNDTDADGDSLTAVRVSGPSNGSLTLNSDGSFSYTPAVGFTGTDSFTYTANDGELDSNVATVSITVKPDSVEPWFEDSFENDPPGAWGPGWTTRALYSLADTTDEVQPPSGGGAYVYREFYPKSPPHTLVTLDSTTSTFTSAGHGFANDTIIAFSLFDDYDKARVEAHTGNMLPRGSNQGGTFPTPDGHPVFDWNRYYRVINATDDTFQIIPDWLKSGSPLAFLDNGTDPFYTYEFVSLGGRSLTNWGVGNSPIPVIGEGQTHDDFSLSYRLKYADGFDVGAPQGGKNWRITNEVPGGRLTFVEKVIRGNPPVHDINFTSTSNHQLNANVNGGPLYVTPGEWVKFDWYFKVSSEETGILLGWVNNVLRWEYRDIQTLGTRGGNLQSFYWWAQISGDLVRVGPGQERYLDLFRIGPGSMVLSEQGYTAHRLVFR